jgi:hypothetical protein
LPGECGGLGAIGEVEFGEDVADVGLNGAFGDDEAVGDDGVAESVCDEVEELEFAVGELADS